MVSAARALSTHGHVGDAEHRARAPHIDAVTGFLSPLENHIAVEARRVIHKAQTILETDGILAFLPYMNDDVIIGVSNRCSKQVVFCLLSCDCPMLIRFQ